MAEAEELKPLNDGVTPTNPQDGSHVDLEIKRLEINMFFDGTWNNMNNNNRFNDEPDPSKRDSDNNPNRFWLIPSTSYSRAPTGLEMMYKAFDHKKDRLRLAVYVEGTGTEDNWGDSPISAGLGWFWSGLNAKTKKGFRLINKKINQIKSDKSKIEFLQINAYGFSRGATSARSFSNRALKEVKKFKHLNLQPGNIQINFVGLFDTVSSAGLNHGNDTKNYDLAFTSAHKVVHLTAQDEARHTFSCYDISSAIEGGFGLEVALPGCHTDLGGGLSTKVDEIKGSSDENASKDELDGKKDGWYVSGKDEERDLGSQTWQINGDGQEVEGSHEAIKFDQGTNGSSIETLHRSMAAREQVDIFKMKENLIDKGWYTTKEIEISEPKTYRDSEGKKYTVRELKGKRNQLSIDYPRVPTQIMVDFITKYQADSFIKKKLEEYEIPSSDTCLQAAYKDLKDQAMSFDDKGIKQSFVANIKDKALSQQIYNKYLHWSASGGPIHGGQIQPDGTQSRTIHKG